MKGFRLDRPADRWCLGCGLVLVLSLLLSNTVLRAYVALTDAHPFAAGFCKFALLATFGESLAQRMLVGRYLPPRFGLVPRALAWGALGICITLAFMIFSAGVPLAMSRIGMDWAARALAGPFGTEKLLTAFAISLCLNTLFAPVLMVAHKVSDLHIARYEGTLRCLWHLPDVGGLLKSVNWDVMWRLGLFRTVLFFWIPVHTITFLLPEAFRVLFAALLGAVLGLISRGPVRGRRGARLAPYLFIFDKSPLAESEIKERLIEALSQTDEKSLEHIYNSILFALNKTRQ